MSKRDERGIGSGGMGLFLFTGERPPLERCRGKDFDVVLGWTSSGYQDRGTAIRCVELPDAKLKELAHWWAASNGMAIVPLANEPVSGGRRTRGT